MHQMGFFFLASHPSNLFVFVEEKRPLYFDQPALLGIMKFDV